MRCGKILLTLLLTAMVAAPIAALAQPMGHGPGEGGAVVMAAGPLPMPLMMIMRQLNLTPEQQAKVHQIMDANFKQSQPLMKQLHTIHDQMADKLMSTGPVSASDLEPLQQQEAKIHQQLDEKMMATALKIRGLLTPKQLSQAAELHEKLKSLRAQMDALVGSDMPMGPPGF